MEQENVEIVRALYEAFNRDDLAGMVQLLDPNIEVRLPEGGLAPETVRGHEAIAGFLRSYSEAFEAFRVTPTRLQLIDDRVLAECRASGRGRSSGVAMEVHPLHLWRLLAGKATRLDVFPERDRGKALQAVGLRE